MSDASSRSSSHDTLRPLDHPRPVPVRADGEGRPRAVRIRGQWKEVEGIREVWRIDDEWWRRPLSRRYYTVVLEGGGLLTLYRELAGSGRKSGEWFTHGGA